MKKTLYLILITFLFISCSDEQDSSSIEKRENQTINKEPKEIAQKIVPPKVASKTIVSKEVAPKEVISKKVIPKEYKFLFHDLENHSTTLYIKNDLYHFSNIKQPIVMIAFFATWCPPCRGQIPHLSNLQKKFQKHLFILSTLVHDDASDEKLKKFIIAQKVRFFIANGEKENLKFADFITPKLGLSKDFPLPLMILFVNGKYFTHYEGMMPEEMIESDIKQVLKKIDN